MEKLLDYKTVQLSVLQTLWHKEAPSNTNPEDLIEKVKYGIKTKNITEETGKFMLWYAIIYSVIHDNHHTNKLIEEALHIVNTLVKTRGYRTDMNKSNFMIRMTSIGPQVVFTDPIAHNAFRVNKLV